MAVRWSVALRYIKDPDSFNCEYCEEKNLVEKRNCGWKQLGTCKECGEIPFEDVSFSSKPSRFVCPYCGGRVRFGKSEFVLGKSFRTPGCPKSQITERALFLIQLVRWSESTGKLPTSETLLGESYLFFDVRSIVLSEENIAESEMAPKEGDGSSGRKRH